MPNRQPVDLSAHINEDVTRGHPADFPITLKPVGYRSEEGDFEEIEKRFAVVRTDTGRTLSVVSDRYKLVSHQRLLDVVAEATAHLDLGPVPRGIYVDRHGARMRAIFKFPALAQAVVGEDEICPCIRIENTYDASSRISVHIGAFRFVCTNLAMGGGGTFAGGFMSVHAGNIPMEGLTGQLGAYLRDFDQIMQMYREWEDRPLQDGELSPVLAFLPDRAAANILLETTGQNIRHVFGAYNVATNYATHRMRSAHGAFKLLEEINRTFQRFFPPSEN